MNDPHDLGPDMAKTIDLLRKLPTPKPCPGQIQTEDMVHAVCHCNKVVDKYKLRTRWSGYVYYLDNACKGCQAGLDPMTKVICVGCKGRVVARMEPGKDKDGFDYKRDGCVHIRACRVCTPGLEESDILEKVVYMNRNKK